jgi:hypothetical protein
MPEQFHIDRIEIQMTISSAPSAAPTRHGRVFFTVGAPKQRLMRAVAFIVTPPRLKPGLSSQDPSGRNGFQSPTDSWAKSRPQRFA